MALTADQWMPQEYGRMIVTGRTRCQRESYNSALLGLDWSLQFIMKIANITQYFPRRRTRLIRITTDTGIEGWGETTDFGLLRL